MDFRLTRAWSLVAVTADPMGDLADEGADGNGVRTWNFGGQWLEAWLWWAGLLWSFVGGGGSEYL